MKTKLRACQHSDVVQTVARSIKVVVTDVDGVLTNGGMYYTEDGDEIKKFNVRDGMGVALLKASGLKVGAISGESTSLVKRRLEKIGLDFFYLGVSNKRAVLNNIRAILGCASDSIAYVGDELNDMPLVGRVGLFLAPSDASVEILTKADHVLEMRGGEGVLREVAELILTSAGLYEGAVDKYTRSLMNSSHKFSGEVSRIVTSANASG